MYNCAVTKKKWILIFILKLEYVKATSMPWTLECHRLVYTRIWKYDKV